jgi:hypothetical protein
MPRYCVSESFNAIYFGPESAEDHEVPLIVWPHGGPHSAFTDYFKIEAALFGLLGKMESLHCRTGGLYTVLVKVLCRLGDT